MTIKFILPSSLYNCELQVTDANQTKSYMLLTPLEESDEPSVLEVEVSKGELDVTVIPILIDVKEALDEFEQKTLMDKLVRKGVSWALSVFENVLLRVGCKYHISNACDGDVIRIDLQQYIYNSVDSDIFDLMPIMYMFYELTMHGERLEPVDAFAHNRKDVLKSARGFALADFGIHLIFTYPFQVGRVKQLTKNKKIFKTLLKFHRMPEEKRERLINKMKNS